MRRIFGDSMIGKEEITRLLREAGAVGVGFSSTGPVDSSEAARFTSWVAEGCHATMDYLERHVALRENPESVLPGVRTVISVAFPYSAPSDYAYPIARYACGEDYHKALRRRLKPVCREIERDGDCKTRICIDSAPVSERYYALRSGIGRRGLNGCVIVDGVGSFVFLAEILVTAELPPDEVRADVCAGCGACVRACPTGALRGDGSVDARRCLSFLTIEKRGALTPDEECLVAESGVYFGCDRCQTCCPHNRGTQSNPLPEFEATENLDAIDWNTVTEEEFAERFGRSALRRAGLERLRYLSSLMK